jgi:hypothetical protein
MEESSRGSGASSFFYVKIFGVYGLTIFAYFCIRESGDIFFAYLRFCVF